MNARREAPSSEAINRPKRVGMNVHWFDLSLHLPRYLQNTYLLLLFTSMAIEFIDVVPSF